MTHLMNDRRMVTECCEHLPSIFDCMFKCVSSLVNMLIYKVTMKRPLLLGLDSSTSALMQVKVSMAHSNKLHLNTSICLNLFFERIFHLNSVYFNLYF